MKGLWKGNLAVVEGAIAGGLDAYFGYPITPQNEIPEYMSARMREIGRTFLQAESELAAINMVFGAALTGKKAMTTSSSPGISLMQEGISYLVGSETPAVIVNVQRGGPGLGNISGSQGDYFQTVKGGGHGDYKLIVFTPGSVQEMHDMAKVSFDVAFKYRNPVIILTDGVLGQMSEPAEIKVIKTTATPGVEDLGWNLTGARGRKPRFIRSLFMGEGELEKYNYKLAKKFETMKEELDWEEKDVEDAKVILVGYGTSGRINLEAYQEARKKGLKVGFFRLKTVYPFPEQRLYELSKRAKFLAVEMSMGQMVEDVKLAVQGRSEVRFYGKPGGGLPEVGEIIKIAKAMMQ
ncbi:MAG: 3-methyl-2-oxobutanoate dehydrogenase subunit VorB [Candidatus Omnitrophica bacterium]|nr:3-methyl-2-oxobutanoate dehydrogenase subunit VorB [Candidatus Omnitrophota bacterium]